MTAGLTGMDPNVKICIYGDCNVMLLFSYISEICSAFEIRLLIESSYNKTNDLFWYQTRTTEWFDFFFSRMHFMRVL